MPPLKEMTMTIPAGDISPLQLSELLDRGTELCLLDVREPAEVAAGKIGDCLTIPLAILPLRMNDLPRDRPLVVYCHMGGRSAQAARFLQEKGFRDVHNLSGGIQRWINDIDPTLTKY